MVDEYGMDISPATYTLIAITEVINCIDQDNIDIQMTILYQDIFVAVAISRFDQA